MQLFVRLTHVALLTIVLMAPSVYAFAENELTASKTYTFQKVVIEVRREDHPYNFDDVTSEFKSTEFTVPDLQRLADKLTRQLIDEGYFLSRAVIPAQNLSQETLVVRISEGFISDIRFTDAAHQKYTPVFTRAMAERPATLETYEAALLRLQSMSGVSLKNYRQYADPGTPNGYILEVTMETSNLDIAVGASNRGQRNGEATKGFISININSVLRKGDVLRTGFITKPAAPEEFKYYSARYQMPLLSKPYSVFAEASYSNTKPLTALAGRTLSGETTKVSLGVERLLLLRKRQRLWASARFDYIDADEEEDLTRLYMDKLRVIRGSVGYTHLSRKGALTNAFMELSHGLDALDASTDIGRQASRLDANGQFTKLFGEITHRRNLTKNLIMRLGATGQYSDKPLLYSEEFSFGGGNYGRGYDFGEVLGDAGAAGFAELGYKRKGIGPIEKWELYSFADAGTVWNKGVGLSVDGDVLYSAGLGVRLDLPHNIRLSYEAAEPLSDAPYTLQDYYVRHRFDVSANFKK